MTVTRRIARTLGDLALALFNATLILVILAALAVGFAVNAVQRAGEEGVERATAAALRAAEIDPARLEPALEGLAAEVSALRKALADGAPDPETAAALRMAADRLAQTRDALRALREPTVSIDQQTLLALGAIVEDALNRILGAASPAPGVSPE